MDASQGQVLLAVYKDGTTADLYISDEWGINYSLSLRNIITNNVRWNSNIESFDFHIVSCIIDMFIAMYIHTKYVAGVILLLTYFIKHFFLMMLYKYDPCNMKKTKLMYKQNKPFMITLILFCLCN